MSKLPEKPSLAKWTRPLPQGNPFSPLTTELRTSWFLISVGIVFFAHWILAYYVPPTHDELYYWAWSKTLAGGYYDHPPMVAYLIRASTTLFGDTVFAIRFFACLFSLFTIGLLAWFIPYHKFMSALLYTPLFFLGSILMTPDIPMIFFWISYVMWLAHLNVPYSQWQEDPMQRVYHRSPVGITSWVLGGVILGLGLLSKYTMLLVLPCSGLFLLRHYRVQSWVIGFSVHLLIGVVIALPLILYNFNHGFESFAFQWQHAMANRAFSLSGFWELLGGQVLLVGALPLMFFPLVLLHTSDFKKDPRLPVCYYFFVLPLLFFCYRSLGTKVEANWPIVAFLSFWPLAQFLFERSSFKGFFSFVYFISFIIPHLLTVVIVVHLIFPLQSIPPKRDRVYKLGAYQSVTEQFASDFSNRTDSTSPLFATTYQWTAQLLFKGLKATQMPGIHRGSHFTRPPTDPCQFEKAYVFANQFQPLECMPFLKVIKDYPIHIRGTQVETYHWYLLSKTPLDDAHNPN